MGMYHRDLATVKTLLAVHQLRSAKTTMMTTTLSQSYLYHEAERVTPDLLRAEAGCAAA
jgi:hypothetical protein